MDILLYGIMVLLGLLGSFFSGLLGIGGAIIKYPLFLFVPAGLDVAHFSAQEVSTISMFQVFFASLAGVLMDGLEYAGVAAYLGDASQGKVNLFI